MSEIAVGQTVFAKYVVEREIARGGMGLVFLANHMVTGRKVALKCLEMERHAEAGSRLMREARALGVIRHPNVVDVYDAGTCPVAGPYIAMEMIEGRPLGGILATKRRLPLSETLRVIRGVARGLSAAHSARIVHRDVKPDNVLVSSFAEGARVSLIDFGIARFQDESSRGRITRAGDLLGTLDYMAPEQLASIERADARSDQYSLAVMMHECLTGELPRIASRLVEGNYDPTSLFGGVDAPLAIKEALARAMNPDPGKRFEDIDAFDAALDCPHVTTSTELARTLPPSEESARRRFSRAPYVTPCRIHRPDGSYIDGRTEDISEGGLLVLVDRPITSPVSAAGEQVRVSFSLPLGGQLARLPATLRWSRGARGRAAVGLEFTRLDAQLRSSISAYVVLMGGRHV